MFRTERCGHDVFVERQHRGDGLHRAARTETVSEQWLEGRKRYVMKIGADDQLVMRRELHYSQLGGVKTITFDMPTDGGTYDAMTDDGEQPFSVSWDGAELVLISEIEVNIGLIEVIDRYRVDNDGQELVQERMMDIPTMGVMESTMVFLRRE